MTWICGSLFLFLSFLLAPNEDTAQEAAGPRDLALAFLRFEEALKDHPVSGERLRALNQAFDQATLLFFTGDFNRVARALNGLALSLQGGDGGSGEENFASSLRVRMVPQVYTLNRDEGLPRIHITQWFTSAEMWEPEYSLGLVIHPCGNESATACTIPLDAIDWTAGSLILPLDPQACSLGLGRYRLDMVTSRGFRFLTGFWNVAGTHPDEVREAYQAMLDGIKPTDPGLAEACSICRARIGLLDDRPANYRTTPFFVNIHALRRAVRSEMQSLLQGRNPYLGKKGNYWRVLKTDRTEVPMRIYAPSAVGSSQALPLVIAFHGAGGDENLFAYGYGSGRILELAEKQGFLLAMPQTYAFMRDPALLEPLIRSMARHYKIDPERIYVLGHSLGAATAATLAGRYPDQVTAACCLAGGGAFHKTEKTAPLLIIAAELDPISPVSRARKEFQNGIARGLPLEFHVKKNQGHTLMVGACLEDSLEWLLKKRPTE
jgi:predicted esterase